ncbi:MAG: hypothetical protein M3Q65_21705, partial [Chloroflexota bacterium]|nr:hypothetical protein [Chloroflexota bacterium]
QGLFKFSDRIVIVRADRAARGTPEAGTTGAAPGYVVAGAHWLARRPWRHHDRASPTAPFPTLNRP